MPNSPSKSNITAAIRTRRRKYRYQNDFFYVCDHPSFSNISHYIKCTLLKTAFGRIIFLLFFVGLFYFIFFTRYVWPKFIEWLHKST